jgi:hypothetical protein
MTTAIRIGVLLCVLMASGGSAAAQIITPTKASSNAANQLETAEKSVDQLRAKGAPSTTIARAQAEVDRLRAETKDESAPTNGFLPQASFLAGSTSGQVSVDAATLYFKEAKWRFYLRSTLSTDIASKSDDDEQSAADALKKTLDDRIKNALNDPYGGLLYLAAGRMFSVTADQADPSRGWFVDARGGAKFVQVPGAGGSGNYRVTPFLVGSVGLRLSEPLWYDTDGKKSAGRLDASVSYVRNHVLDKSVSGLFNPDETGKIALSDKTNSVNVALGLSITDSVGLIVSGTAWSSAKLDRTFAIGLSLLNK